MPTVLSSRFACRLLVVVAWLQACSHAGAQHGIWISAKELQSLPTSGTAWDRLKQFADRNPGTPNIADQKDKNNVFVLAKALVYARTGDETYRKQVVENCMAAIGTEKGGRTLPLGRKLCSYVVAADLVGLDDARFRQWLKHCRSVDLDGRTLVSTHESRPNNWGVHCGASRLAVAIALDDRQEIERVATLFRAWLGDRKAHSGFEYGGDLSWQVDAEAPVGINPKGAVIKYFSVDGALPEEMRRGGAFQDPPMYTGYAWGALQGAFVQAEMLYRRGYPAYEWQDKALLRAVEFLYRIDWKPKRDDQWLVWLVNKRYGTRLEADEKARPGKNMGWTAWTHQ